MNTKRSNNTLFVYDSSLSSNFTWENDLEKSFTLKNVHVDCASGLSRTVTCYISGDDGVGREVVSSSVSGTDYFFSEIEAAIYPSESVVISNTTGVYSVRLTLVGE